MRLKPIANNMTELHLENGMRILFSYDVPVAACVPVTTTGILRPDIETGYWAYIMTSKKWSATTYKHIEKWLVVNNMPTYNKIVDQSVLDDLVGG